jgi:hypothetical protein
MLCICGVILSSFDLAYAAGFGVFDDDLARLMRLDG